VRHHHAGRRMLKLTLDTNCIIAAAQGEPNAIHVDQLAELARAGRIMISVTSGFAVDQRTARPNFQQANLNDHVWSAWTTQD
jgi:hypothetical protein